MTESTPDTSSGTSTTDSKEHGTQVKPGQAVPSSPRSRRTGSRKGLVTALVIAILLLIALAAALWYQQQSFRLAHDNLTAQLQQGNQVSRAAEARADEALQLAKTQSEQLAQLQATVEQSQSQVHSLQQALQMLTDTGSNLAILNDIDHLVTIAHQQLLLSGNVANAIVALETAQAQLARTNRPALAPLQQAINGDLDRLRAVSTVDVNNLSSRLEELSRLVGRAPLLVPDDAAPEVPPSSQTPSSSSGGGVDSPPRPDNNSQSAPPPAAQPSGTHPDSIRTQAAEPASDEGWWRRGLESAREWTSDSLTALRRELGDFIRVRRVDDPSALLLSSEQGAQLRDSMRLRIMTAQLALLMHQPEIWRSELDSVVRVLETRYDGQSQDTQRALQVARKLAETPIDVKLPTVRNSQDTLQALREDNARMLEQPHSADSNGAESPAVTENDGSPANGGQPAQSATPTEQPEPSEDQGAQPQAPGEQADSSAAQPQAALDNGSSAGVQSDPSQEQGAGAAAPVNRQSQE